MIYWPAVAASSLAVSLFLAIHLLLSGVDWSQLDDETQALFLWLGRTVWVAVLLMAAKGW
jgi:hypothetical protein